MNVQLKYFLKIFKFGKFEKLVYINKHMYICILSIDKIRYPI